MSRRNVVRVSVCAILAAFLSVVFAWASPQAIGSSNDLIREAQTVRVNGLVETWQLKWKKPPEPECPPADDISFTCPCSGFAYGESGELALIRLKDGREYQRVELSPLFDVFDKGKAILQAWDAKDGDFEGVFEHIGDPDWRDVESNRIQKRPLVRIINPEDFDHDGKATEFFLQTDALPCGKSAGVVVGIPRGGNRFRVFGSVAHPNVPLVLQRWEWDTIRKSSGPTEVVDWNCGDHGSDEETVLQLQATSRGIQVRELRYECTVSGRGRLISSRDR